MPFGISSAPEEFQRRMHTALQGLHGVEVIADDILVFGCGNTDEECQRDHDVNLKNLLQRARDKELIRRNLNYVFQQFHIWDIS